jgi:deazaflavin-dependent oxidoreductase (nitroreductase family)
VSASFGRVKRVWLWIVKHGINPPTMRLARAGRGKFALIRHIGRRSGATFENPLILARVPEGFIAELTYGPQVNWYRNIVAASGGEVFWKGSWFTIDRIADYDPDAGRKAFGFPASALLRVLRRREFRLLHVRA